MYDWLNGGQYSLSPYSLSEAATVTINSKSQKPRYNRLFKRHV